MWSLVHRRAFMAVTNRIVGGENPERRKQRNPALQPAVESLFELCMSHSALPFRLLFSRPPLSSLSFLSLLDVISLLLLSLCLLSCVPRRPSSASPCCPLRSVSGSSLAVLSFSHVLPLSLSTSCFLLWVDVRHFEIDTRQQTNSRVNETMRKRTDF